MRTLEVAALIALLFGGLVTGCAQLAALRPKVEAAREHSAQVMQCAQSLGAMIAQSGKQPPMPAVIALCASVEAAPPLGGAQ